MTVYIVTRGEYSDYSILAVFSDKSAAERYVETANLTRYGGNAGIEEWKLDPPNWENENFFTEVTMDRDGNADSELTDGKYHTCFYGDRLSRCVPGTDVERAVKSTNELRARIIGAGVEWGNTSALMKYMTEREGERE